MMYFPHEIENIIYRFAHEIQYASVVREIEEMLTAKFHVIVFIDKLVRELRRLKFALISSRTYSRKEMFDFHYNIVKDTELIEDYGNRTNITKYKQDIHKAVTLINNLQNTPYRLIPQVSGISCRHKPNHLIKREYDVINNIDHNNLSTYYVFLEYCICNSFIRYNQLKQIVQILYDN